MKKKASKEPARRVSLLLDSGAFSAWNRGEEIDVKAYIAFVKANAHVIDSYVSLDTIPGSMGRMDRSQESIEKSAAASYKNQQVMKDAGLHPIPVFHQGERYEWLERYVDDGEPYIGISQYMRSTRSELMQWLDECFTRVTDRAGRPLVKTHGFGTTSHEAIWRYPWQSVDSTTWAIAPAYGMLITPRANARGDLDLRLPANQLHVGNGLIGKDGGGAWGDWSSGRSLEGLGERALDWIHKYAEICGTSVTAFRNDQYARTTAHIMYFKLLEERRGAVRFAHRRAGFFASGAAAPAREPADVKFRVIFATQLTNKQSLILSRLKIRHRLLSYYNLRADKNATARLEQYVTQGHLDSVGVRSRTDVGGDITFTEPAVQVGWSKMHYTDFRRRRLVGRFSRGDLPDVNEMDMR